MRSQNLGKMNLRSLVVFAGDPSEDLGLTLLLLFFFFLHVGVVFFPSLPSMGVMLFRSSVLRNAPGENGASLALPSLFLFFFFLLFSSSPPFFSLSPLLFLLSPSPSFSFFFPRLILPKLLPSLFFFSSFPLLSFSFSFILSFSFALFASFFCFPFFFFLFFFLVELLVLNAFQDVIEGTTDCN